uniref:Protein-serine/threonine phosphatase n=1 Tax=Paramoeba aestuarina TaxID=180227 RepID=A0A7S4KPD3_9EUKA
MDDGLLSGEDLKKWAKENAQRKKKNKAGAICLIIPNLYQGTKAAAHKNKLTEHNIDCVMSIGGGTAAAEVGGVDFVHIGARDGVSMLHEFEETVELLHEALEENKRCLVHCMGGFSRSPTIVIAYLMRYRDLSLVDALHVVRLSRPNASPNGELREDLVKWEEMCRGKK